MDIKERSYAQSPAPSDRWRGMSADEKVHCVSDIIGTSDAHAGRVEMVEAEDDGRIILRFTSPVAASERGGLLLDLEDLLKRLIDKGLTVWLEPLGDKSSLRRLRGIEVKKR